MSSDTTYTEQQYETIEEVCIEHAVFGFIEEFGLIESDFIKWASDNGVDYEDLLDNMYDHIDDFVKDLSTSR